MKNDFLQDTTGNNSSKRLWGSIILTTALIFSTVLFWYSIYTGAADATTAINIINAFFIAGGGLLGISVVEVFGKQKR
jgi:hypothetical protein